MGVQFALFQSFGKYDLERRMLKNEDKGDDNSCAASLRRRGLTESGPLALDGSTLDKASITSCGEIVM